MAADKMQPVGFYHVDHGFSDWKEPGETEWIPLYTADQIRSEIEAVRAKYPIARDGELAAIVHHALDALRARMGIDTPTEKIRG